MKKIGFIGAGNMAEAIIKGILKAGLYPPSNIILADINQDRLLDLHKKYGPQAAKNNSDLVTQSDIIIFAVKPQIITNVLKEIAPEINKHKLLISIAAGIKLSLFKTHVGEDIRIIRVMPNTPALVLKGITAICSDGATQDDIEKTKHIFSSIGSIVIIKENLMDVTTGLSGSGPAYVAMIIEALTDGGVLMGLPREISQELALQTVSGTAHLLMESKKHPALLKDMVSSPGGTTIQGIYALEKGGLRASLMEAIKLATIRSQELGKDH